MRFICPSFHFGPAGRTLAAVALLLAGTAPIAAAETISYTYDARGRLIRVNHAGSVNDGVQTSYTLDKDDNRLNKTVTGAATVAPTFSISAASVTEGGTLAFQVNRGGSTDSAASVGYASANGTAVAPGDYSAASGVLSFAAGEAVKTVTVVTIDDASQEASETLTVTLSNPSAGTSIASGQATGTITDNDAAPPAPPPSFTVNDAAVAEGGALVFTITSSGSATASFNVNYATANATALAGSDYSQVIGSMTFAPGETSKTVSVTTINDAVVESEETLLLDLSNASGGPTIADAQGTGTINDDDVAPAGPSFAIGDASITEGGILTFTVTRSGSTSGSQNVSYATVIGTASANDFTAKSGTLIFTSGQASKTIIVQTTSDSRVEEDELMSVNLSSATGGATITDAQGLGSIGNDDFGGDPCPLC